MSRKIINDVNLTPIKYCLLVLFQKYNVSKKKFDLIDAAISSRTDWALLALIWELI